MITIQVRLYNTDLKFIHTSKMDSGTPEAVRFVAGLIIDESSTEDGIAYAANIRRKPMNLCNMMVRKNGKLVSYKDFM